MADHHARVATEFFPADLAVRGAYFALGALLGLLQGIFAFVCDLMTPELRRDIAVREESGGGGGRVASARGAPGFGTCAGGGERRKGGVAKGRSETDGGL